MGLTYVVPMLSIGMLVSRFEPVEVLVKPVPSLNFEFDPVPAIDPRDPVGWLTGTRTMSKPPPWREGPVKSDGASAGKKEAADSGEDLSECLEECKELVTVEYLLPVRLQMHFDNARLGPNRRSFVDGVEYEPAFDAMLRQTLKQLNECADEEQGNVVIRPYGFASNAPFRDDWSRAKNDEKNRAAADQRAANAFTKLDEFLKEPGTAFAGVEVRKPVPWGSLEEMKKKRAHLIPFATERLPDSNLFTDRSVILEIEEHGRCEVLVVQPKEATADLQSGI